MTSLVQLPTRHAGIDAARGLAVVAMMVDHSCMFFWPDAWGMRWTVGRVAMPLFFVLAGYLVTRLTMRHAGAAAVGLALPWAVPQIDRPNVLVWWALGCVLLVLAMRWAHGPAVVLAIALAGLGNGLVGIGGEHSYPPLALVGLMAAGRLMRASSLVLGDPFGRFASLAVLAPVGRAPLRWYVGHLLVLEGLYRLVVA